ncbi:MAG: FtsQ-type POTRA domain-containing protein [Oscillospiraceae bacterium]|nr:FtsQ-type POTRA domain-containing protein [Oscillospiraceae bacterium]
MKERKKASGRGAEFLSSDERLVKRHEMIRRKKRKRDAVIYLTVIFFAVSFIAALSLTVFFNISAFNVEPGSYYTAEEIIGASGLAEGSNMFINSLRAAEKKIENTLPYAEKVKIKRQLPDVAVITVTDAKPAFAIPYLGSYILISQSGKVLNGGINEEDLPEAAAAVIGVTPESNVLCGKIASEENKRFNLLLTLQEEVKNAGLAHLTEYDISDEHDIRLVYEGRMTILVGTASDLDKKLKRCRDAVTRENLDRPYQTATVDLTVEKTVFVRN